MFRALNKLPASSINRLDYNIRFGSVNQKQKILPMLRENPLSNGNQKYHQQTPFHKSVTDKRCHSIGLVNKLVYNFASNNQVTEQNADIKQKLELDKDYQYQLNHLLKSRFKEKMFKNIQKDAIKCLLQKRNMVVCTPTGSGKSLIYQIATFVQAGVYLYVSPFYFLTQNQEKEAKKYGIRTYKFKQTTKTQRAQLNTFIEKANRQKKSTIIFLTPEVLGCKICLNFLQKYQKYGYMKRVIVDEAHCFTEWEANFVPKFRSGILQLRKTLPNTPVLALSGTERAETGQKINQMMNNSHVELFRTPYKSRSNLFYEVRNKTNKLTQNIGQIIQQYPNRAVLIYCSSDEECQTMAEVLTLKGYKAGGLYFKLGVFQQDKIYNRWMNRQIDILVVTPAFGSEVNHKNVRAVIHTSMPVSLEQYVRESSIAGLDGVFARCILFYNKNDKEKMKTEYLINKKEKQREIYQKQGWFMRLLQKFRKIQAQTQAQAQKHEVIFEEYCSKMVEYCENEDKCRHQYILEYFQKSFGQNFDHTKCKKSCDTCKSQKKGARALQNNRKKWTWKLILELLFTLFVPNIVEKGKQLYDKINAGKEKGVSKR